MRGRAGERPRRSKGELYDEIWELDMPPIVLSAGPRAGRLRKDGSPAVEVGPTAARQVLLAMAKHTNPTRDQNLGPEGLWRCCPTVETLAELAEVNERQVQLVLSTFVELGYIELERAGVRAGRNRSPRPSWWRLRPDLWPRRVLKNGRAAGFATNGDLALVAQPEQMVAKPAASSVDGGEAGFAETPLVAKPASPKHVSTVNTLYEVQHGFNTRTASSSAAGDEEDEKRHQVALPMTSAVVVTPGPEEVCCAGARYFGSACKPWEHSGQCSLYGPPERRAAAVS